MKVKQVGLSWIVVKDFKAAVKYYTEILALEIGELNEQYGWGELEGKDGGSSLGISQESPEEMAKADQNAVVTFTVDNIEKGAKCGGEII